MENFFYTRIDISLIVYDYTYISFQSYEVMWEKIFLAWVRKVSQDS